MTRYIVALLLILLLISTAAALLYRGNASNARAERDTAVAAQAGVEDERDNLRGVLVVERARANAMAAIAEQYERDKTDALLAADRLAADLVSGDRRVRHEIAALHTARLSADAAATRELDATAQRGAALVGAAVGIGAECDATQRGLIRAYGVQSVVRADRQ